MQNIQNFVSGFSVTGSVVYGFFTLAGLFYTISYYRWFSINILYYIELTDLFLAGFDNLGVILLTYLIPIFIIMISTVAFFDKFYVLVLIEKVLRYVMPYYVIASIALPIFLIYIMASFNAINVFLNMDSGSIKVVTASPLVDLCDVNQIGKTSGFVFYRPKTGKSGKCESFKDSKKSVYTNDIEDNGGNRLLNSIIVNAQSDNFDKIQSVSKGRITFKVDVDHIKKMSNTDHQSEIVPNLPDTKWYDISLIKIIVGLHHFIFGSNREFDIASSNLENNIIVPVSKIHCIDETGEGCDAKNLFDQYQAFEENYNGEKSNYSHSKWEFV